MAHSKFTADEKSFFNEYDNYIGQHCNDVHVGNLINTAENCGLRVNISQELNHDTCYDFPHAYGDIGTTVNIDLSGRLEDMSKFNCCVDSQGHNEISELKGEISKLKSKINNSLEEDCKFKSILDHTISRIKYKIQKEIDEDIFYSDIWQKALDIVNEEIKNLNII